MCSERRPKLVVDYNWGFYFCLDCYFNYEFSTVNILKAINLMLPCFWFVVGVLWLNTLKYPSCEMCADLLSLFCYVGTLHRMFIITRKYIESGWGCVGLQFTNPHIERFKHLANFQQPNLFLSVYVSVSGIILRNGMTIKD